MEGEYNDYLEVNDIGDVCEFECGVAVCTLG